MPIDYWWMTRHQKSVNPGCRTEQRNDPACNNGCFAQTMAREFNCVSLPKVGFYLIVRRTIRHFFCRTELLSEPFIPPSGSASSASWSDQEYVTPPLMPIVWLARKGYGCDPYSPSNARFRLASSLPGRCRSTFIMKSYDEF